MADKILLQVGTSDAFSIWKTDPMNAQTNNIVNNNTIYPIS